MAAGSFCVVTALSGIMTDYGHEQLAVLVLEYGMSGFILAGDDPNAIALYGQEVAPAARELVLAERDA